MLSGWRRRRRSWSARAWAPGGGSCSRTPRRWRRRRAWTRWCSTRPAPSPAASPRSSRSPPPRASRRRSCCDWSPPPGAGGFEAVPGEGALATVEGKRVAMGNARLLEREHISLDGLTQRATQLEGEGRTTVLVGLDGHAAGVIAIADAPRETAKDAVAALRKLGIRSVMLSGDTRAT